MRRPAMAAQGGIAVAPRGPVVVSGSCGLLVLHATHAPPPSPRAAAPPVPPGLCPAPGVTGWERVRWLAGTVGLEAYSPRTRRDRLEQLPEGCFWLVAGL